MRTALLISGVPRFCAEFDQQIANLTNSEIDWFVVLWNRHNNDGSDRSQWISPSWTATDDHEARSFIESKLPQGHNLAHVELVNPSEFPPLTKQYKNINCTVENLFQQYWILKKCDQRRQELGNYDLVIRSRSDIGISPTIHLDKVYEFLKSHPNIIITPNNHRNPWFNDMFAIGLPDTMKIYCEAVDHIDHFNLNLNVQLHSEIMISSILSAQGLVWPQTDIKVSIREVGTGKDSTFIPDFGRWA